MTSMKALLIETKGIENLRLADVPVPEVGQHEVKIKIIMSSVQAQDYAMAETLLAHGNEISPIPHIAGEEMAGIVEEVGPHVKSLKHGDRVVVYHRIFDGTCDMCRRGFENLCRNRGRYGVERNGGFAEYIVVPEQNAIPIPDTLDWGMASNIAVSFITPYHALLKAGVGQEDTVAVFGATGNTGMFAVQIAKRAGATVVAVSRKKSSWLKDLGADMITTPDDVVEDVKNLTAGKMCNIVIDPLGDITFNKSISITAYMGKWITYGALAGDVISFSLIPFYRDEKSIIGTRGGTRAEISRAVDIGHNYKFKEWKKFSLDYAAEAIRAYGSKDRDGKIFITNE